MDTAKYEQVLRQRQRELNARLYKIDVDLGRAKNADSAERVTEGENDEVLEGLGQAGQDELRAIDAALHRIDEGTFGTCVRCGGPISAARLGAVPHAPLCEHCIAGQ
jgi:RNA polymerase-binding transcription factor DksA